MSTDGLGDGVADDGDALGVALVADADGLVVVGGVASDWHPASSPATTIVPSPTRPTAPSPLARLDGIQVLRRSMRPLPGRPSSTPHGKR